MNEAIELGKTLNNGRGLTRTQIENLRRLTIPSYYLQNVGSDALPDLTEAFDEIDRRKEEIPFYATAKKILELEALVDMLNLDIPFMSRDKEQKISKIRKEIAQLTEQLGGKAQQQINTIKFIEDKSKTNNNKALESIRGSCNMMAKYLYGKYTNQKYVRSQSYKEFYTSEVLKGRALYWEKKGESKGLSYSGTGFGNFGLTYHGGEKSSGHVSPQQVLDLYKSKANVGIVYFQYNNTPNVRPTHYAIIYRGKKGKFYYMDHTTGGNQIGGPFRGGEVKFEFVHSLYYK